MEPNWSTTDVVRGVAVLSVVGLVGVLLYYLSFPGFSPSRLAFFCLIAGVVAFGGVGVARRRFAVTTASAVGLLLLGFWQAALGVFVVPVAALLLLAALLDRNVNSEAAAG